MKILLTGATGFIGKAVCAELLFRKYSVIPVVRSLPSCPESFSGSCIVQNMDKNTNWTEALSGVDIVIHLASRVHVMHEKSQNAMHEYREINTEGTLNLARQAVEAGVKRFVFLSTIKVNGESSLEGQPFRAEDHPHPTDPYAISKHMAEQGLLELSASTELEVVIIRPPLVYGPGVKGNFAAMLKWIRWGLVLPLGAIHNKRSLIALENLVDFIILCADKEKSPQAKNQTFLISDGESVSTTLLLRKVARAANKKARLISCPVGWLQWFGRLLGKSAVLDRLTGSLEVDSTKATTLLGWKPIMTMDEQLEKMAKS